MHALRGTQSCYPQGWAPLPSHITLQALAVEELQCDSEDDVPPMHATSQPSRSTGVQSAAVFIDLTGETSDLSDESVCCESDLDVVCTGPRAPMFHTYTIYTYTHIHIYIHTYIHIVTHSQRICTVIYNIAQGPRSEPIMYMHAFLKRVHCMCTGG